jgi:hypothetical protein
MFPRSNPCNWVGHQQHFNCNFRHFSKTPNWTPSIDDLSCSLSLETSWRWTSLEYIWMNLHCTRIIRAHLSVPSVCSLNFDYLQSCRMDVNKGPKWTSSHQCTNWPFCSLDGLHFFIRHQMGFITVKFFSLLTTTVIFFWGFVLGCFFLELDLAHSYLTHLPPFISIVPTLVPY